MPIRMDSPLPSLEGGTEWFNSDPIRVEDLSGKPVLIHFWSISCGACKEALSDIDRFKEKYKDAGLKIISIHMPRQESDTNVEAVKECIAEYEIKQPCVVDNYHEITDRFQNKVVPGYYLFDAEHKMRNFSAGENGIKMIEPQIDRVLGIKEAAET